jgi:hypothetical protein
MNSWVQASEYSSLEATEPLVLSIGLSYFSNNVFSTLAETRTFAYALEFLYCLLFDRVVKAAYQLVKLMAL